MGFNSGFKGLKNNLRRAELTAGMEKWRNVHQ